MNTRIMLNVNISKDNLGLESDCDWGVPLFKKPSDAQPPKSVLFDIGGTCVKKALVRLLFNSL